jgi:hypothetical protein
LTASNIASLQFISNRNDNRKAILFPKIFSYAHGIKLGETLLA